MDLTLGEGLMPGKAGSLRRKLPAVPPAPAGGYVSGAVCSLIQDKALAPANGFERGFGSSRGDPVTSRERGDLALDQMAHGLLQMIAGMLARRRGFGNNGIDPSVRPSGFGVGRGAMWLWASSASAVLGIFRS